MQVQILTYDVSQLEANLCNAFVDPTRLQILYALKEQPHNVTELTSELGIPQSKTSRHLKVLRDHGLVKTRRQGVSITYELTDARLIEALNILRTVLRDQLSLKADIISNIDK